MRKLILLLFLVMALSAVGVVGITPTQNANLTVSQVITLDVYPALLSFGTIIPGATNVNATNGPISFNPSGSNVDVTVTGDSTTGDSLFSNLEVETPPGTWPLISSHPSVTIPCVGDPCVYTNKTWSARLSLIPVGTPAGFKTGTIIYTISGPP